MRLLLSSAAVAVALVTAFTTPVQAAAPTVPAYATAADGICSATVDRNGKLLAAFGVAVRRNQRTTVYRLGKRVVRALDGEYRALKRLTPPAGQERNVATWLSYKRKAIATLAKVPGVFRKHGRAAGKRYAIKADRYTAKGDRSVAGIPMKVCA